MTEPATGALHKKNNFESSSKKLADVSSIIREPSTLIRRDTHNPKLTKVYCTKLNFVESLLLPHVALEQAEKLKLKEKIGEKVFNALNAFRHGDGLCHSDTALKLIKMSGQQPTHMLAKARNLIGGNSLPNQIVGAALNAYTLGIEANLKKAKHYSMEELLQHGVPSDCVGVIISAIGGVIDPLSKQAHAAKMHFEANLDVSSFNHAIAVLGLDSPWVYCFDGDPHRDQQDPFFKVDVDTFRETVLPRFFFGVMAIPKANVELQSA